MSGMFHFYPSWLTSTAYRTTGQCCLRKFHLIKIALALAISWPHIMVRGLKWPCWTQPYQYHHLALCSSYAIVANYGHKRHVSQSTQLGDCPGSCLWWAFGQSHQGALLPDDPRAGGAMKLICWRLKKGCPERVTIPRPFRCKRNDLPLIYQDLWQFGTTSNI